MTRQKVVRHMPKRTLDFTRVFQVAFLSHRFYDPFYASFFLISLFNLHLILKLCWIHFSLVDYYQYWNHLLVATAASACLFRLLTKNVTQTVSGVGWWWRCCYGRRRRNWDRDWEGWCACFTAQHNVPLLEEVDVGIEIECLVLFPVRFLSFNRAVVVVVVVAVKDKVGWICMGKWYDGIKAALVIRLFRFYAPYYFVGYGC